MLIVFFASTLYVKFKEGPKGLMPTPAPYEANSFSAVSCAVATEHAAIKIAAEKRAVNLFMVIVFNAVKLVQHFQKRMRHNFTYLQTFVMNIAVMKM